MSDSDLIDDLWRAIERLPVSEKAAWCGQLMGDVVSVPDVEAAALAADTLPMNAVSCRPPLAGPTVFIMRPQGHLFVVVIGRGEREVGGVRHDLQAFDYTLEPLGRTTILTRDDEKARVSFTTKLVNSNHPHFSADEFHSLFTNLVTITGLLVVLMNVGASGVAVATRPNRSTRRRMPADLVGNLRHRTVVISGRSPCPAGTEGGRSRTNLMPFHPVKGFFADYRHGRGLFGKHRRMVWMPPHHRGNAALGVISKDYHINTGQDR
jgi:hypothetical protein